MLLVITLYFLLVSAALALWFLPSVRAWARQRVRGLLANSRAASQTTAQAGQQRFSQAHRALADAGAGTRGWTVRNARWLALTAAVLLAPTLLAVSLRGCVEINGYDTPLRARSTRRWLRCCVASSWCRRRRCHLSGS